MKKLNHLVVMVLLAAIPFYSCRNNSDQNAETPYVNPDNSVNSTAPVVIHGDVKLRNEAREAVNNYPSVTAVIADSVIILTGEIDRADWQKLNPTLNSLHPKRINITGLTIK